MKDKKRKTKKLILILFLFLSCFLISQIQMAAAQEEEVDTVFKDEMICEEEGEWTDTQWQFYKVIVPEGVTIDVELSYEGDLDLDLRVYWKRDNGENFNGFDVTHCDIDSENYKYEENSQLRTTNTENLGYPEELSIFNPSYVKEEDQIAYILVFVYEGEGESKYTLSATEDLTLIEDNEVYDCNFVELIFILYLIGAVIIIGLFSFYVYQRKLKITGEKDKKKQEKREAKKEKQIEELGLDAKI